MGQQIAGYIIGGILPAILLGIFSVFLKASTQRGISPGMLLIIIGINIIVLGIIYCWISRDYTLSLSSGFFTSLTGLFWGIANLLIIIGLSRFSMPISKLVPLFNMNTMVAVIIGLFVFAEWKNVNIGQLLLATLLIIIGGTLAANS